MIKVPMISPIVTKISDKYDIKHLKKFSVLYNTLILDADVQFEVKRFKGITYDKQTAERSQMIVHIYKFYTGKNINEKSSMTRQHFIRQTASSINDVSSYKTILLGELDSIYMKYESDDMNPFDIFTGFTSSEMILMNNVYSTLLNEGFCNFTDDNQDYLCKMNDQIIYMNRKTFNSVYEYEYLTGR